MKAVLAIGMMLVAASVATPVDVEPTPGGLLKVSVAVCCCAASLVMVF